MSAHLKKFMEWTQEKHHDVCKTLERFIDSGEVCLNHSHMGAIK